MYSTWGSCKAYGSQKAISLSFKSPPANCSPHHPQPEPTAVHVSNQHVPTFSQNLPPGAQKPDRPQASVLIPLWLGNTVLCNSSG